MTSYPELEKQVPEGTFPSDVIERAHLMLNANPGGSGAYSVSQGIHQVCKDVADFISRRDGYPCDPREVFLSNGASQSVQNMLMVLSGHPDDGFLIPVPQYCDHHSLRSEPGWLLSRRGTSLGLGPEGAREMRGVREGAQHPSEGNGRHQPGQPDGHGGRAITILTCSVWRRRRCRSAFVFA